MKVQKESEGHWDILSNDKIVGSIQQSNWDFGRRPPKTLYVGDKRICTIANQKEAIIRLEEFFAKNKKEIEKTEKLIEELTIGITQVTHQICIDALNKERDKLDEFLTKLKSYDLI
ncbi:hypothetical protein [Brevibacillus laterosporus]|uniref:hypothetical protein n=1 Tax=Brevibacillus laterosporus TaxID=1465 RepID=UPI003D1AC26F